MTLGFRQMAEIVVVCRRNYDGGRRIVSNGEACFLPTAWGGDWGASPFRRPPVDLPERFGPPSRPGCPKAASMFPRQRYQPADLLKPVAAILLTGMAACSSQATAPSGAGLCWRMVEIADQQPEFRIMARDVPNLESCAVQLEGARMMEGRPTTGAYNGHFIFTTEEQITSAVTMDGTRIRVFEAGDRREIQDGLRTLIERQGSQARPAS